MAVGVALYYDLKYPLDTTSEGLIFSRMPNMQVLCPYHVKDHMKAMLYWQMCGFIFQIWAQWIYSKTTDFKSIYFIYIFTVISL